MSKGYDNIPALFQTILDIPMSEANGALVHDIARQQAFDHNMALAGATITWAYWPLSNVQLINFNGATPDRLELAAIESTDLDYQAGAFSGAVWVYPLDLVGAIRTLFCKGATVDGWEFIVNGGNGSFELDTVQVGPVVQETISSLGVVVLNTWYLLGFSRLGASVRLYRNGVDATTTVGDHINPDSAAARDFHIGCCLTHANGWTGYLWRPRIWSRQISLDEHKAIFEMERGLFGV